MSELSRNNPKAAKFAGARTLSEFPGNFRNCSQLLFTTDLSAAPKKKKTFANVNYNLTA